MHIIITCKYRTTPHKGTIFGYPWVPFIYIDLTTFFIHSELPDRCARPGFTIYYRLQSATHLVRLCLLHTIKLAVNYDHMCWHVITVCLSVSTPCSCYSFDFIFFLVTNINCNTSATFIITGRNCGLWYLSLTGNCICVTLGKNELKLFYERKNYNNKLGLRALIFL